MLENKMVFSSCCAHTHLLYLDWQEIEYIGKIKDLSYEEIAKRGGGLSFAWRKLA